MNARKTALHRTQKTPADTYRGFNLKRIFTAVSYRLLPGACLLCGLSAGHDIDLCSACEQGLPRLGLHCDIAGTMLPAMVLLT